MYNLGQKYMTIMSVTEEIHNLENLYIYEFDSMYLYILLFLQQRGGELLNLSLQLSYPLRERILLPAQLRDEGLLGAKFFSQLLYQPAYKHMEMMKAGPV